MTHTQRSLTPAARTALNFLLFAILICTPTAWAKNKNAAKEKRPAAKAQTSRNDKGSRASARNSKNPRDRAAKEARVDKRHDKNAPGEHRASRKEQEPASRSGSRALSKRERQAEARRLAEQ